MRLLAKTLFGLEDVLAEELNALGALDIEAGKRAVYFSGDRKMMYSANLNLRTAMRILLPIREFQVRNEQELYDRIRDIDWEEYMDVNGTLAIDGVSFSEKLKHSKYVALKTKDAIVDQFRDKHGKRPNVNTINPTLRINIHLSATHTCTVSLDSSGDSLHKRGYRFEALDAPINEVLAAGMIQLSGWQRDCNFIDAMCGSGTILMEAAGYAYNIPPQLQRENFGFKNWKDFDEDLWNDVLHAAKEKMRDFDFEILGFDKNFQAIRVTERNILAAHMEGKITVTRKKFERLEPPAEKGILIMNPPYDERLQEINIDALYKMVGDQLKQKFAGYEAWLITSNMEAMKHFGLRPSRKIHLFNGSLPCKFFKFELYAGSKKHKYSKEV